MNPDPYIPPKPKKSRKSGGHVARTGLSFRLGSDKRKLARRQLETYLAVLHHTDRASIVYASRLIRLLSAPEQLSREEVARRLFDTLAIQRSRQNWGRPWTLRQIIARLQGESRPVWNEDLRLWTPKKIPRLREMDMSALDKAFQIAKLRRAR